MNVVNDVVEQKSFVSEEDNGEQSLALLAIAPNDLTYGYDASSSDDEFAQVDNIALGELHLLECVADVLPLLDDSLMREMHCNDKTGFVTNAAITHVVPGYQFTMQSIVVAKSTWQCL